MRILYFVFISASIISCTTTQIKSPSERLGTAFAFPRYNPNGKMDTVFRDGARDLSQSGFKTIKIWLDQEVISNPNFYKISPEKLKSVKTMKDLISLDDYKYVLSLPFSTVFLLADPLNSGNPFYWALNTKELTESELKIIYQETYELSVYLLEQYAGTKKTFVLQNHEGDWHIIEKDQRPTELGLLNFKKYWQVRQKAVEDARKKIVSDVHLYHMCEVVRVLASAKNETEKSLTRDVLPNVACDLIGYSAYDSIFEDDPNADPKNMTKSYLPKALNYIKSKASISPTFGDNQVMISEIGVPENEMPTKINSVVNSIKFSMDKNLPYVLLWNFYDNECRESVLPNCTRADYYNNSLTNDQVRGFWVKKPDGNFGEVFKKVRSYLTN